MFIMFFMDSFANRAFRRLVDSFQKSPQSDILLSNSHTTRELVRELIFTQSNPLEEVGIEPFISWTVPVGKIAKKQSEGVRFFVNLALKIQCHAKSKSTIASIW